VRASRHPLLTIAVFLVVVLVAVVVATFVAVWRAAHTDEASTVERADAILVLGAAEYDGRPGAWSTRSSCTTSTELPS
jgi:type II secretory pathway component PulK